MVTIKGHHFLKAERFLRKVIYKILAFLKSDYKRCLRQLLHEQIVVVVEPSIQTIQKQLCKHKKHIIIRAGVLHFAVHIHIAGKITISKVVVVVEGCVTGMR